MFFAEALFASLRSQTTCFSTCSKPCTISPAAYCKLSNFPLFETADITFACGKTARPKGGETCTLSVSLECFYEVLFFNHQTTNRGEKAGYKRRQR